MIFKIYDKHFSPELMACMNIGSEFGLQFVIVALPGLISYLLLYARLKNGTYYVKGYGVRPQTFSFLANSSLQFTSDQAETWHIVRS